MNPEEKRKRLFEIKTIDMNIDDDSDNILFLLSYFSIISELYDNMFIEEKKKLKNILTKRKGLLCGII